MRNTFKIMHINYFLLIWLNLIPSLLFAQIPKSPNLYNSNGQKIGDWTILFDKNWNPIQDSSIAEYYRKIFYENNTPKGIVTDYYRSGQKQWVGFLTSEQPDCYIGKSINYFKNGNVYAIGNYDNCQQIGLWFFFDESGFNYKLKKYIDNVPVNVNKSELSISEVYYCEGVLKSILDKYQKNKYDSLSIAKLYVFSISNLFEFYFDIFSGKDKYILDYAESKAKDDTVKIAKNWNKVFDEIMNFKFKDYLPCGNYDIQDYNQIGLRLNSLGGHDEIASKFLFKAIDLKSQFYGSESYLLSENYFELAKMYYNNGEFNLAKKYFNVLVGIEIKNIKNINDSSYLNSIIEYYYSTEDFGNLENILIRYLDALNNVSHELNPPIDNFKLLLYKELIKLYFELGDYSTVDYYVKELDKQNELYSKNDIELNHIRGQMFLSQEKYADSFIAFKKNLELAIKNSSLNTKYYGFGIKYVYRNDTIILTPIVNSPAANIGLIKEDVLVSINNKNVIGVNDSILSQYLKKDTALFTIKRKGIANPLKYNLKKDSIPTTKLDRNIYECLVYNIRLDLANYYFKINNLDSCLYYLKQNLKQIDWGGKVKKWGYFSLAFKIGRIYELRKDFTLSDLYFKSAIEASLKQNFDIINEINKKGGYLVSFDFLEDYIFSDRILIGGGIKEPSQEEKTFDFSLLESNENMFVDNIKEYLSPLFYISNYFKQRNSKLSQEQSKPLIENEIETLSYKLLNNVFKFAATEYLKQQAFLTNSNRQMLYEKTFSSNIDFYYSYYIDYLKNHPKSICDLLNNRLIIKSLVLRSKKQLDQYILEISQKDKEMLSLKNRLDSLNNILIANESHKEIDTDINQVVLKSKLIENAILGKVNFEKLITNERDSWIKLKKKLNKDEVGIETIRFNYKCDSISKVFYLFIIITNDSIPKFVIFNNGDELEKQYYKDYSNFMNNSNSFDLVSFDRYWSKIDSIIKGKKTIYFSPDGVYSKININTLYSPKLEYYIKEKNIIYMNSLFELFDKVPQKLKKDNSAVLFGDPKFSLDSIKYRNVYENQFDYSEINVLNQRDFSNIHLTALPLSRKEINTIDTILNQQKWTTNIYMGENATEENFKKIKNVKLIHIATHGYFTENMSNANAEKDLFLGMNRKNVIKNPMLRSGLLLSGCQLAIDGKYNLEKGIEDGILSAAEIMNMNFSETELVVLSACNSGRGEIMQGEGVFGLQRAFSITGARSVLMSLWKVDDRATMLLMSSFYRNWLINGKEKHEALKLAIEELRQNPNYDHPYFWGAFVLIE